MTKTIINNNMTTFGEVENGTFFTDSENHFCYKVSENQILDFTLNEFLVVQTMTVVFIIMMIL